MIALNHKYHEVADARGIKGRASVKISVRKKDDTPSANDIEKDGGFNVGEIFINHQEKTEEVFLHLIALKKQTTSLKKEEADLDLEHIFFLGLCINIHALVRCCRIVY